MPADPPESDWKLFRKYKDEMLEALTGRINDASKEILDNANRSQHERYLNLYDHIDKSNRIIGNCFNDWRRSTFGIFASQLARQNLIPRELWDALTDATRQRIERLRDF